MLYEALFSVLTLKVINMQIFEENIIRQQGIIISTYQNFFLTFFGTKNLVIMRFIVIFNGSVLAKYESTNGGALIYSNNGAFSLRFLYSIHIKNLNAVEKRIFP